MLNMAAQLKAEFSLKPGQAEGALALLAEGASVPFIARYRKERTGGLDEVTLRALAERRRYLDELAARRQAILKSIDAQGKLTADLRGAIEACLLKTELEDLYLPFKPKRRTRAAQARDRGLAPLADWIHAQNTPRVTSLDLEGEAARYVDPDRGVRTRAEALQGASDILAEAVADRAPLRAFLRDFIHRRGTLCARLKRSGAERADSRSPYEAYATFSAPLRTVAAHSLLAILRGEREAALRVSVQVDDAAVLDHLRGRELHGRAPSLRAFYGTLLKDAWERLLKPSLVAEAMRERKAEADTVSIGTFADNLRHLLLSSPAGMKPTLGVDPGWRSGCKLAAVDGTGRFLEHRTVHPHTGERARTEAANILLDLVARHGIQLIAVGNGTAGRETEAFVRETLAALGEKRPLVVSVSEAGASVYSASDVAVAELPDLDVTVRGAVSIARRLQDPLAELVKIEPRSIGVGQYQHDVDQTRLKRMLDETVESCVNHVGVNVNTASPQLLSHVAGMTPAVAHSVVRHRETRGPFASRQALLDVPRLGPKVFEQASGFLRIPGGENVLDNTGVHPERYGVVEAMAADLGVATADLIRNGQRLAAIERERYLSETLGAPTLDDILAELDKPGRDSRDAFKQAVLRPDVRSLEDLRPGMALEGTVTNVTHFGAFVDLGVQRDGLIHISQLSEGFVRDPGALVHVGQVIGVRVLEVDLARQRIQLTCRQDASG